jgi:hypothetical protein
MNFQTTQDAFMAIERLAALCATPGINEDTQKIANAHIQNLLNSVVKDAVTTMSAKASGLVVV